MSASMSSSTNRLGMSAYVLNWMALGVLMRKPAWVFDARGVADPEEVKAAGLNLWCVGDGQG